MSPSAARPRLQIPTSRIVRALVVCVVAACTGMTFAGAAENPPAFAIKTKAVDGTVLLDAAIKSNPALAADCLAEGKRFIEKQAAETEKSFKDDPQLFADGGYTFERSYTAASVVDGRYVSVVRTDYIDTRGAHPNTLIDTILWDDADKKRISIRPFFKETTDRGPTMRAMVKAVIAALKKEKKKRGIDNDAPDTEWYKDITPSLLKIGPVTLASSGEPGRSAGLLFHYEPYAVGPYAEGSFEAFVPWQTLKPYLSAKGAAIFAGERPAGDEKDKP